MVARGAVFCCMVMRCCVRFVFFASLAFEGFWWAVPVWSGRVAEWQSGRDGSSGGVMMLYDMILHATIPR
jgi:hypothetical protein